MKIIENTVKLEEKEYYRKLRKQGRKKGIETETRNT